jgi:hypothetical protein
MRRLRRLDRGGWKRAYSIQGKVMRGLTGAIVVLAGSVLVGMSIVADELAQNGNHFGGAPWPLPNSVAWFSLSADF